MRTNTRMIDQGIHAGIAGSTVMLIGALPVQFPLVATTYAVKLWGAAAGVASTVRTDASLDDWEFIHWGVKVVMNPDSGKSWTPKHTWPKLEGTSVSVRFTFALSPTLMVTAEGLTSRTGPNCRTGRIAAVVWVIKVMIMRIDKMMRIRKLCLVLKFFHEVFVGKISSL